MIVGLIPLELILMVAVFNSAKEEDLISIIEVTSRFDFWEQTIGHKCTLHKTPYYSVLKTGMASHGLNGIYNCHFDSLDQITIEKIIQQAQAHFSPQNLPYSLIIGQRQVRSLKLEALLQKNNFTLTSQEFGMALALHSLIPPPSVPHRLRITRVTTQENFRDFIEVTIHGFGLPSKESYDLYGRFTLGPKESQTAFFVGYFEKIPVTAALVTCINGIACLHNVVTLPRFRGKGFGSAITYTALLHAKNDIHLLYATLQAGERGKKLYTPLGFRYYTMISTFNFGK